METKLHGIVKNGSLNCQQALENYLKNREGKVIIIIRDGDTISDPQRDYWCSVIVGGVREWMNAQGNNYKPEAVHLWLKETLGFVEYVHDKWVAKSFSRKASEAKKEISELIEKGHAFMAEKGIPIREVRYGAGMSGT